MQRWAGNLALTLVLWRQPRIRAAEAQHFWPQWRGPLATAWRRTLGHRSSGGEGKNIRLETALRQRAFHAHRWGDRIFLTTAMPRMARVCVEASARTRPVCGSVT